MRILYIELVLFIKFIKVITKVLERKIINKRGLFPSKLIIQVVMNLNEIKTEQLIKSYKKIEEYLKALKNKKADG